MSTFTARSLLCLGLLGCIVASSISNASCTPEPLVVKGGRTIVVSGFGGLNRAIRKANETGGYITILLADGEYLLNRSFAIRQPGITIKGQSGNRDAVIVRGKGYRKGPTIIFRVSAAHFTIADLTIGWVRQHAIQIKGENGADYPMIHNLRIVNTGEQMVKVTAGKGKKHRPSVGGVVQWSEFGFTEGVAPRFYTGGIDAHGTKDWIVRNNVFKNIRSPEQKVAEHAIHFWNNAQGTIVEGNTIINSDRGIGFGLSKRTHLGGVIRNNMVHTTRDVGIGLENASDAKVYNNTVFTENYHNSIEYRFSGTINVEIMNNLVNKGITKRNGGNATVLGNVTSHPSWFVNPRQGDLHLSGVQPEVIDQAEWLHLQTDFDCDVRPQGKAIDIGADEMG